MIPTEEFDERADPSVASRALASVPVPEADSAGEQALHHWQTENPQHKHGKHVYSRASEDVGLSSDEIRDHFSHYMNHYGLRAEKR